ncbi:hypothetical protein M432DRAFT_609077 [Thermoascus aurantiacus ATCC 26904]
MRPWLFVLTFPPPSWSSKIGVVLARAGYSTPQVLLFQLDVSLSINKPRTCTPCRLRALECISNGTTNSCISLHQS